MSRQLENSTDHQTLAWPRPFAGLRGTQAADLPLGVAAGVTLAAMIIPPNIGFTQVAGLPPTAGLYAGIIPLVLFAIFTSSRQVVSSPDAPITALLAATLGGFAVVEDPLRLQYRTNRHAMAAFRQEYDLPRPETGPAQEGSDDE